MGKSKQRQTKPVETPQEVVEVVTPEEPSTAKLGKQYKLEGDKVVEVK